MLIKIKFDFYFCVINLTNISEMRKIFADGFWYSLFWLASSVSKFDMATAGNYARIYGSGHSPLPQTRTSIPAIAMLIRTLSDLQNLCTCALSGMMNIRERRDIRSN